MHAGTEAGRGRIKYFLLVALSCLVAGYATLLLTNSQFLQALLRGSAAGAALGDFGSFYASGRAAREGMDPYDVYEFTMDATLGKGHGAAINLNAPFSVALFELLAPLDPHPARVGWYFASILAYGVTVGLLLRAYPGARGGPLQIVWPFALAGFWETIDLGQVYAFLALLSVLAWLAFSRQAIGAGILIGAVVAFKPNFVVWPIFLLLAGHVRPAAAAIVSTVVFGLLPIALYGPQIYSQWFAALALESVNPQVANASLPGLAVRVGAPQWLGIAAGGLSLLLLTRILLTRRPAPRATSGVALVGLLLASPIAWVGYSLFLLPAFMRLLPGASLALAAALLCIPRLPLQEWADASIIVRLTLGSAYTVAWLLLAFASVKAARSD